MRQCEARTKKGCRCSKTASYGPLCKVHVRQLSSAGTAWRWRKVVRNHLSHIDSADLQVAVENYRQDVGPMHPRPYTAGAWDFAIVRLLSASEDGLTTDSITDYLNEVATNTYSNYQVGAILGQLRARGRITREVVNADGRKVTLWKLFVKM